MLNAHFLKTLIPLCCPGSNEASLLNNKIHFSARQICIFVFSLCIEVKNQTYETQTLKSIG